MSTKDLRTKLIRLAHEHPEMREQLLPLIKNASDQRLSRLEQQKVTTHLMRGGVGEWDVDNEIERELAKAIRKPNSVVLLETSCIREDDQPGDPATDIEVMAEISTSFNLATRGAKVEMTVTFPFYWEDMDEIEGR